MPDRAPIPQRRGPRPRTTPTNPYTQLDLHPAPDVIAALAEKLFALPRGPRDTFMVGTEFAHLPPLPDGTLHVALPPQIAREATLRGWREVHPVARLGLVPDNVVMLYAPRDDEEAAVVLALVRAADAYGQGRQKVGKSVDSRMIPGAMTNNRRWNHDCPDRFTRRGRSNHAPLRHPQQLLRRDTRGSHRGDGG